MNVFVFGAGVSGTAGLPLNRDLYSGLRQYVLKRARNDKSYVGIKHKWQLLERQKILATRSDFEMNLTRLDIEILKNRNLQYFRDSLGDALTDFFNDEHKRICATPGSVDNLRKFAQRHIKPGDVIITFNYDCLVERVLKEGGLWSVQNGYGFARTLENSEGTASLPRSACKVLKLHGSLGWVSSVIDSGFFIQKEALEFAGYEGLSDSRVARFGGQRPLILPSFVKQMHTHPLPELWRLAAETVRGAETVIFLGYSMPDADSAAWILFLTNVQRRALYCWYNDVGRAGTIRRRFEEAGIDITDRKGSLEFFATTDFTR